MKKYARVFLKGEPIRWFDFPLPDNGSLFNFIGQARHEGGAIMEHGWIAWDSFASVMLIQLADVPALPAWAAQPAGQA